MLATGSWRPHQVSPKRLRHPIRNHDRASYSTLSRRALRAEGGCIAKARAPKVEKRRKQSGRTEVVRSSPEASPAVAAALYCVRLSDGYHFPAPKSQFAEVEELSEAADQCRFICQDEKVELFQLPSFEHETSNLVSVETGQNYTELTTAYRYRDDDGFQGCNHKRYYARVNELRARTVTPFDLSNAIVPLPTFSPRGSVSEIEPNTELNVAGVSYEHTSTIEQTSSSRDIRIVGAPFFPE